MSQLSRPFQIALAAVVLLAAVWLLALRGHKSSGEGEHQSSSAQTTTAAKPSLPTAPGVAGLTRAIEKAHGAVALSERNAKQLQEKSAEASNPSAASPSSQKSASTTRSGAPGASKKSAPSASVSHHHAATRSRAGSAPASAHAARSGEALVQEKLAQGYTVALLFWNPQAADDRFVHEQLKLLLSAERGARAVALDGNARELGDASVVEEPRGQKAEEKLFLEQTPAGKVASFGSVTRAVQVYQTPTLLIVNPKHQVSTLTGFRSAFAIEQALDEAPSA
jgi:hypothetical protein